MISPKTLELWSNKSYNSLDLRYNEYKQRASMKLLRDQIIHEINLALV